MFDLFTHSHAILATLKDSLVFVNWYEVDNDNRLAIHSDENNIRCSISTLENGGVSIFVGGDHLSITTRTKANLEAVTECLARLIQEVLLTDELACA